LQILKFLTLNITDPLIITIPLVLVVQLYVLIQWVISHSGCSCLGISVQYISHYLILR